MSNDAVTEAEIESYLDGELDLVRQLAVESHLAERPDAAAALIGEMRTRTSLRLLAGLGPEDVGDPLIDLSSKLSARLGAPQSASPVGPPSFGRRWGAGLAVAAALLLLLVIPIRHELAEPPSYVDDAVAAYHTGLLRAALPSQLESPHFDAGEIQRSTRIHMPRLPAGWEITDAQIFPSPEGPALQLMIHTSNGRRISIFAVRARSGAPALPTAIRHDNASVAYWRVGEMSYALTGTGAPEAVDIAAERLASGNAT